MRIDLRGRGGLHIQDKWRAGPVNYLGLAVAGFPNLFNVAGPGSTSAFTNFFVETEYHVDWIADCVAWLDARGHATIEASEEAESRWVTFVNATGITYTYQRLQSRRARCPVPPASAAHCTRWAGCSDATSPASRSTPTTPPMRTRDRSAPRR